MGEGLVGEVVKIDRSLQVMLMDGSFEAFPFLMSELASRRFGNCHDPNSKSHCPTVISIIAGHRSARESTTTITTTEQIPESFD